MPEELERPAEPGSWRLTDRAAIRRADRSEVDAVAAILEDAGRFVASLGVQAWPLGTFVDPAGWGRRPLVEALESGGLFLAKVGPEAAATVSLFDVDERFWPGAARDALYIHKLAVARRFAGLGLGAAMVEWSAVRARAGGKRFLRLDCPQDDPPLRRYYERAGFLHRGDLTAGTFRASLYERPLEPR
jgi:GNAT superfamily N-acetyltransferase